MNKFQKVRSMFVLNGHSWDYSIRNSHYSISEWWSIVDGKFADGRFYLVFNSVDKSCSNTVRFNLG